MPLLPSRTGSLGFRGREFERAAKVVTFCNTPNPLFESRGVLEYSTGLARVFGSKHGHRLKQARLGWILLVNVWPRPNGYMLTT